MPLNSHRIVATLAVFFAVHGALGSEARADKIDDLTDQLRGASSYKVRLSAALTLTKLRDSRAIDPLIGALRDQEKAVRGVAAAGLGKVVTAKTPTAQRDRALTALERVIASDNNDFVRRQAQRAYNDVKKATTAKPAGVGTVFVDLGAMGDKTGENEPLRLLMRKTVEKTFEKKAAGMSLDKPSSSMLKKMKAFHVDGTLTDLSVSTSGASAEVACKVSMLIATYPKKSMFGFLNGGARVQTGSSSRDVRFGKEDCVAAVIEDLVARKVIPTLEQRSQ